MKNVLIIFNPTAGKLRQQSITDLKLKLELERLGHIVTSERTTGPGTACQIVASHPESEFVVIAGGDGTIRDALPALKGTSKHMLVLPCGTANVLALEAGFRADHGSVLKSLEQPDDMAMSVGEVNGDSFGVMAGIGVDAEIAAAVNLRVKSYLGKAAYVLAAIKKFLVFKPTLLTVRFDGVEYSCSCAIFCNGRYYAGAFILAPDMSIFNDELTACLFNVSNRRQLFLLLLSMLFNRLEHSSRIVRLTGKHFEVSGEKLTAQLDGDAVFYGSHVTVGVAPTKVNLSIRRGL